MQEAFVRLLKAWPTVSSHDDPEAWTRMVAFRLLSNRRRTALNGGRALLRLGPSSDTAGPTGDGLDVARGLARLPLAQRQVVVLHHLVGLGVAEVADGFDVAPGTAKSRLRRARTALAPLLREETFHAWAP